MTCIDCGYNCGLCVIVDFCRCNEIFGVAIKDNVILQTCDVLFVIIYVKT